MKQLNHTRTSSHYVMMLLLLGCLFFSGCADAGEDELITKAKQITQKYKLTEIKPDCLTYEIQAELYEGKRIIDAREIHSTTCGGDLNTSPRAFSIGIDEKTGEIVSDAKSLVGQLEPLDGQ